MFWGLLCGDAEAKLWWAMRLFRHTESVGDWLLPASVRGPRDRFLQRLGQHCFRASVRIQSDKQPPPSTEKLLDLVFFVPELSQGWILEGICKDAQKQFQGTSALDYRKHPIPRARGYFIAHYSEFEQAALCSPHILKGRTLVFFTHARHDLPRSMRFYAATLNFVDVVFVMNQDSVEYLISLGVEAKRIRVILGAADPDIFKPHPRKSDGKIGFCTKFYDRKQPEMILHLVRQLPRRKFLLLGKGWRDWSRFAELSALPNFEYMEAPYSEYPGFYSQIDVFVSPATLEGGPIPLLEAMFSNAVPIASRTGFAPDIIRHGENGFLYEPTADPATVAGLIEQAFQLQGDIAESVRHLTWKRFSQQIEAALEGRI